MDTTFSAPLIFLTADGLISGWSEGAERLLGWSAAEVIGQPYAKVFDDLDFFIAVDGPMDLEWLSVPAPDGGRVIAIRTMKTKQLLERFDLTMSNSEIIGTWNWNIAGDMISADSRFAKAFGLEVERARQRCSAAGTARHHSPAGPRPGCRRSRPRRRGRWQLQWRIPDCPA